MIRLFPRLLKSEQSIQALKTQLHEAQTEGSKQENQISESDQRIVSLQRHINVAVSEQGELLHEFERVEKESDKLRGQLREALRQNGILQDRVQTEEHENRELQQLLNTSESKSRRQGQEIAHTEAEVREKCVELLSTEKLRRSLQVHSTALQMDNDELRAQIGAFQREQRELKECQAVLQRELQGCRSNLLQAEQLGTEARQHSSELEEVLSSLRTRTGQLEIEHASLSSEHQHEMLAAQGERQQLGLQLCTVEEESCDLRRNMTSAENEHESLQKEHRMLVERSDSEAAAAASHRRLESELMQDLSMQLKTFTSETSELQRQLSESKLQGERQQKEFHRDLTIKENESEDVRSQLSKSMSEGPIFVAPQQMSSPLPETHGAQSVSVEVPEEREDRGMLGQEEKQTCDWKLATICVLTVFVVGLLVALIVVLETSGTDKVQAILSPRERHPALSVIEAFYVAVDNKNLEGIAQRLDKAYLAFFGPGCATVGGATRCNNCTSSTLNGPAFVQFISEHPSRTSRIQRHFVMHGLSVMNHYTVKDPVLNFTVGHGAVVHVMSQSPSGTLKLAESFWYADG